MNSSSNPSRVLVGVVVSFHGLKGELVVEPQTDSLERFGDFEEIYLNKEDSPREIESWRIHKGRVLLFLQGINSRTEAEPFRKATIEIPFEDRVELPEDRFYHDDLVGLDVLDLSGEKIGVVKSFDDRTANGLVRIKLGESQRAFDVPFANVWIPEISLKDSTLTLAAGWRGLLDPES